MQKQIKGHPDYAITDSGEVISYKRKNTVVLMVDDSNGYPRVSIDGRKRYLANLVAEHFLTKPMSPDYKIFYIDGDPMNCSVDNLIYLSQANIQRYSNYTVEYRKQILAQFEEERR